MRTKILITALAIIVLTGFGIAQLAHPTLNVQGAETPAATLAATMSATESAAALRFDGNEAMKHAAAQVNFGFRPTGSAESIKAGDYIIAALKSYGWTVTEQPITLDINGQTVKGRNIIGSQGSGPVIIFGAHYDTRLWADHDPDPANQRKPVMGADDGASGVAIMLELARVLNRHYTYDNEIRLVFLDAEDNGNIPGWKDFSLGTYQYVDKLDKRPEYVVILDMLGDKDLNVYYEGASMRSAPQIMEGIWNVAEKLGYGSSFIKSVRYTMIDDHTPFIAKGIPAIDMIDFDYPYWHTVQDTLDKISGESMEKVGRTVQTYLEETGAIKGAP